MSSKLKSTIGGSFKIFVNYLVKNPLETRNKDKMQYSGFANAIFKKHDKGKLLSTKEKDSIIANYLKPLTDDYVADGHHSRPKKGDTPKKPETEKKKDAVKLTKDEAEEVEAILKTTSLSNLGTLWVKHVFGLVAPSDVTSLTKGEIAFAEKILIDTGGKDNATNVALLNILRTDENKVTINPGQIGAYSKLLDGIFSGLPDVGAKITMMKRCIQIGQNRVAARVLDYNLAFDAKDPLLYMTRIATVDLKCPLIAFEFSNLAMRGVNKITDRMDFLGDYPINADSMKVPHGFKSDVSGPLSIRVASEGNAVKIGGVDYAFNKETDLFRNDWKPEENKLSQ